MRSTSAVIVAAGRGTRMGPDVDKLFLEVCGQPIIAHTWRVFDTAPSIDEIILVVRDGMQGEFEKLAENGTFRKEFRLVVGGAERQNSVSNGLLAVSAGVEIVAIQDGARPCTTHKIIADCVEAAREMGAAVAAQRVTDTLKKADGSGMVTRHLDRSRIWAVQTPQAFRIEIIRRALDEVLKSGVMVTDDTGACELIGQPVKLVESETPNPKATSRADLPYLEILLKGQLAKQPRAT